MIDTFYQKENLEVYKRYLYFQLKDDSRFQTQFNDNEFHITYQSRTASIHFHDIGMIEEKIISDDKQIFYLHFPLTTFPIALELYQCMINKLIEEKVEPMKVLFIGRRSKEASRLIKQEIFSNLFCMIYMLFIK